MQSIVLDVKNVRGTICFDQKSDLKRPLILRAINKSYLDNANAMKGNATRGCVYTIHKYTLTNTSNTFQINQQQQT